LVSNADDLLVKRGFPSQGMQVVTVTDTDQFQREHPQVFAADLTS
jgi:hypothetical protein